MTRTKIIAALVCVIATMNVARTASAQSFLERLEKAFTGEKKEEPAADPVDAPPADAKSGVQLGLIGDDDQNGGVLVLSVKNKGPAATAGIQPGDVVTAVNGKQVRDVAGMADILRRMRPNDRAEFTLNRDGKTTRKTAVLAAKDGAAPANVASANLAPPQVLNPFEDPRLETAAADPKDEPNDPFADPKPATRENSAGRANNPFSDSKAVGRAPLDPEKLAAPRAPLASPEALPLPGAPDLLAPRNNGPLRNAAPLRNDVPARSGASEILRNEPLPSTTRTPSTAYPAEPYSPRNSRRASLGVVVNDITADTRFRYRVPVRQGAFISDLRTGSAAEKAGLSVGSAIVAFDGRRINSAQDLVNEVVIARPGQEVEVTYYQGENLRKSRIVLTSAPAPVGQTPEAIPPLGAAPAQPQFRSRPATPPPATPDRRGLFGLRNNDRSDSRRRPLLNSVERLIDGIGKATTPRQDPRLAPAPANPNEIEAIRRQIDTMQLELDQLRRRLAELELRR